MGFTNSIQKTWKENLNTPLLMVRGCMKDPPETTCVRKWLCEAGYLGNYDPMNRPGCVTIEYYTVCICQVKYANTMLSFLAWTGKCLEWPKTLEVIQCTQKHSYSYRFVIKHGSPALMRWWLLSHNWDGWCSPCKILRKCPGTSSKNVLGEGEMFLVLWYVCDFTKDTVDVYAEPLTRWNYASSKETKQDLTEETACWLHWDTQLFSLMRWGQCSFISSAIVWLKRASPITHS